MKSVSEVSKLAQVSVRTLHYYDEKGILTPSHFSEAGYRYYSNEDINKLKLITIFKELGLTLNEIRKIMTDKDYDEAKVIETQRQMLVLKRDRLNHLIEELTENNQYQTISVEENRWELIWDEIYATQGVVQSEVLEPVKDFVD
ncbi:MerR family transcriptional regulator [Acidaminobacter sp. JC074]|uniref:MerR family transcriptional regulator n=1 Tax=Acidaminobacter sp. JC074 TaxID=2530199 RepID=UPI001F0EEE1E|nr:MerR family transcriptional regulator [Acidaminobacter sp. JC074]